MNRLAARFATDVAAPVVLDSTEPEVMEAGLQRLGGRCVLNSANLEDGEGPGSRIDRVLSLAREYGAAVICLLIDERGQARDAEWKMEVAHRIHDLAVGTYGLESADLIFDPLTFPLSTGDEDLRGDAMATIEAIRRIKAELPGTSTVLGISNVSFGLKAAARKVLNSVFLHECLEAGLDSAIAHAGKLLPLNKIAPAHVEICRNLIYDRREPTARIRSSSCWRRSRESRQRRRSRRIAPAGRSKSGSNTASSTATGSGSKTTSTRRWPQAQFRSTSSTTILLAGMKTVGDLFASGEMQLPFVLRSAETMKAAVRHLEPHMEKADTSGRGSIVLGTVKGDVHDIGKNLVDIILTNNGYDVHNLGIKVTIAELIDKLEEVGAPTPSA